jgi:hypothetical protein
MQAFALCPLCQTAQLQYNEVRTDTVSLVLRLSSSHRFSAVVFSHVLHTLSISASVFYTV